LTPRICVSIMPANADETEQLINNAEKAGADFIEVRLDKFTELGHLAEVASHGKTPKIATLKLASQCGKFTGTESQQREILLSAAKAGFAYVDVDLQGTNPKKFAEEVKSNGTKVIASFHNFTTTPAISELNRILDQEISLGGDVCKIVTTANCLEDNLTLLSFVAFASKRANVVCFGMKEAGRVSRLLSPLFGGFFTFASLESRAETAPGQLTIDEMKAAYSLLEV